MSQKDWKQTEATVFTCGVQDHYSDRVLSKNYIITFNYEVDGHWYSGEFNSPNPRKEGSKFTIRYDPSDPNRNTMHDTVENRWINVLTWPIAILLGLLGYWLVHKYW